MSRGRLALKLRQLEYFLAVSESLHFSNAAGELSVSQPTLSHQIAELEAQIGTRLFNRNGKSVTLTEGGSTLQVYARRALAELASARDALQELEGLKSGLLRIGVSQSFVRKLLPPILAEFMGDYPGIRLAVNEQTAAEIEQQLAAGALDIGIAFAPAVLEETELEPLLEERLVLAMRTAHPVADQRQVAFASLEEHAMAMLNKDYSTRRIIDGYIESVGFSPRVVCETNSIAVLLGVVQSSDVVTIVPEGAVNASERLAVVPLTAPSPTRTTALLWSRHNFRTKAARAFAELIRQRFEQFLPLPRRPQAVTADGGARPVASDGAPLVGDAAARFAGAAPDEVAAAAD